MMHELCNSLQKISLNHKRIMNRMLDPYELTYAQYLALKEIEQNPGILAQALIPLLDSDKATLSGILRRLFQAGWIEKEKDTTDRRKQHLKLTAKAVDKLSTIHDLESHCETILLHTLSPRDQKHFTHIIKELVDNQQTYLSEEIHA